MVLADMFAVGGNANIGKVGELQTPPIQIIYKHKLKRKKNIHFV
jgi:hypothetical protein